MEIRRMHEHGMEKMFGEALDRQFLARRFVLAKCGFDELYAEEIAKQETEERKSLAWEVGPHMAFLANLQFLQLGTSHWGCVLNCEPPPDRMHERQFTGFIRNVDPTIECIGNGFY